MDWNDLFAALALVLIIEGIMPFANPTGVRRACALLTQMDDAYLRLGGIVSMLIGAVGLWLVRQ
jgi:uncharacterized protein YjeT (DUF2065 family)